MAFISHNSLPYWVEKIESVTLRKWEFARLSPRLELKRAPNREKGFVRYFIKIQGCELKLGYPIWPFPLPISEPRLSPSFSSSLHSFRISLSRPTANYFFFVLVFIKSFTRASLTVWPFRNKVRLTRILELFKFNFLTTAEAVPYQHSCKKLDEPSMIAFNTIRSSIKVDLHLFSFLLTSWKVSLKGMFAQIPFLRISCM